MVIKKSEVAVRHGTVALTKPYSHGYWLAQDSDAAQ